MGTPKRIFALGFFDGVHLGHQALLSRCVALARQENCEAAAITFDRHPKALVWKEPPVLISTPADRHFLLEQYGIRYIRQFPVIPEVTGMPWREFLNMLLEDGAAGFVCGDDFRFGWKGEGNALRLQEYCRELGFPCVIVPEQLIDGIRISSTYIRSRIESGDMETAISFLGHPYILSGTVIMEGLPLCEGIFTAKLRFPDGLVVPRFGVYACRALVGEKTYPAVAHVACRHKPEGGGILVESWIPGCGDALEGRNLMLEFHALLRPERVFSDPAAIKADLEDNFRKAQELLGR